jgi:hypothetical protein
VGSTRKEEALREEQSRGEAKGAPAFLVEPTAVLSRRREKLAAFEYGPNSDGSHGRKPLQCRCHGVVDEAIERRRRRRPQRVRDRGGLVGPHTYGCTAVRSARTPFRPPALPLSASLAPLAARRAPVASRGEVQPVACCHAHPSATAQARSRGTHACTRAPLLACERGRRRRTGEGEDRTVQTRVTDPQQPPGSRRAGQGVRQGTRTTQGGSSTYSPVHA